MIVFSDEKFFMDITNISCTNTRQIGYKETIMYRTFYPLLEEIDETYLLVINECMRTANRSELNYNCIAKYTNQTQHRIVFEWLPFISDEKDFMILLDFENSQKYKGLSINEIDLDAEDVMCVPRKYKLNVINIDLPSDAEKLYIDEKNKLFEEIGNKDPNTIPRHLHIWTGKYKKPYLSSDKLFIARNKRFNKDNVTTYKDAKLGDKYILVDIPHRRLDFNDFLRRCQQKEFDYLSTGLSIDNIYISDFNQWEQRLEGFYAKTGIYQ